MSYSHGLSGPVPTADMNRFRTLLNEEKLRAAPPETQLAVRQYRDTLILARAELDELEKAIASGNSVGEVDRLKWKASELRKMIATFWATVGPFQQ